MANSLVDVQVYWKSDLSLLLNSYAGIKNANMRFDNFQNFTGQLGDTVSFKLPPRFDAKDDLVINFQDVEQRKQLLTVDKAKSIGVNFDDKEYLFNIEPDNYMKDIGASVMAEMGSDIEADFLTTIIPNTGCKPGKIDRSRANLLHALA